MHTVLHKRNSIYTDIYTDQEKIRETPKNLKEVGKAAGKALDIIQCGVTRTN